MRLCFSYCVLNDYFIITSYRVLVNKLTHAFYGPMGLSRHPSSAGEHESSARSSPSLPKRSDTFGGFDNGKEPSSPRGGRMCKCVVIWFNDVLRLI